MATLLAEASASNATDKPTDALSLSLSASSDEHRMRSIPLPQLPHFRGSSSGASNSTSTSGGSSSRGDVISIASIASQGAGAVVSWMKVQPATHPWRCARVASYWLMAANQGSVSEAIFRVGLLFETGSFRFSAKDLQHQFPSCNDDSRDDNHPIEGSSNKSDSSSSGSSHLVSIPPAVLDVLVACEGEHWLSSLHEELADLAPFELDECQAAARYSAAAKMGHSQAAHRLAVM